MKKIIMLTFVFFQLIVTQRSSLAIYGSAQNQSFKQIKSVTAIIEVLSRDQELTSVAVEKDKDRSSCSDWRNHDHGRHKVCIRS